MPYNAVIVPRHVFVVRLALFIRALLWHRSHVRFGIAPMSTATPPGRGRPFAAALRTDVALLSASQAHKMLWRITTPCSPPSMSASTSADPYAPGYPALPDHTSYVHAQASACPPCKRTHAHPPARGRTHSHRRRRATVPQYSEPSSACESFGRFAPSAATNSAQLSTAARGCAIAAGPVGRRFARPRVRDVLCRQERERHSRDGGACIANPPCTRAGTLAHIEALMRYGGWLPAWRLEGKNGCIKNGCIGGNGCSARQQTNSCSTAAHPRLCARRGRGALHCTVGL